MKTKLIAGLAALSILAFSAGAMDAQAATKKSTKTFTCNVQGCQLKGNHKHGNETWHKNHSSTEHSQGGYGTHH